MDHTSRNCKNISSYYYTPVIVKAILDWIFYQVCKDQQKNWAQSSQFITFSDKISATDMKK